MNFRYQADADLNQGIVPGVLRREPAIDFQIAFASGKHVASTTALKIPWKISI